MADIRKNGETSNLVRFILSNSSTGLPLTGLSSASSGLIISTIADNEASATTYTVAGSTVESITTLGTFATPTATKCRFKEVDATNHPGLYEFQFADARFAVSNSKRLVISVSGATSLKTEHYEIRLVYFDADDTVRLGLTALPNAAAGATNGLPLAVDSSGRVDVLKINGTSQTARDIGASVLVSSGTGTGQISLSSGLVTLAGVTHTGAVIPTVTTLTNLPAATTDWLTADAVKADAVTKIQNGLATPTNITAGTITTVTNLTNAPTNGDLTATMKASVTTAATAATPTAAAVTGNVGGNVVGSVGSVVGAVGSVTGAVGSVTGSVGSVTGAVGSVTSGVTVTTNNDKTGYTVSTVSDKTGYSLSTAGVDAILDEVCTELTAVTSADDTLRNIIALLHMWVRNNNTATASARTIKNDAGSTVASAACSDNGTTYSQGKLV